MIAGRVRPPSAARTRAPNRALFRSERDGPGVGDLTPRMAVALLRFVGCTATAPEMATLGDELAVSELFAAVDPRDLRAVVGAAATLVGPDGSPARRAVEVVRFLATAPAVIREHEVASCEVARMV